jgi:hypothetical protein
MDEQGGDLQEKIEKMVALAVAAARGVVPSGQVMLPLAQIAAGNLAPPEARELAKVLLRLLNGERDPVALVADLTPEYAEVIWEALEAIAEPAAAPDPAGRIGLTFEELLEKVAEACTGDILLWQQVWTFTAELAADERLPAGVRALGAVLRRILAGERQKYVLAELPAEYRPGVARLLDWLLELAVNPGEDETGAV